MGASSISITKEREESIDFTIPYDVYGEVIVSKRGNEFKSAESLKGKRIGVQAETTSDDFCVQILKQTPVRFDMSLDAAKALIADELDLLVFDMEEAKELIDRCDSLVISAVLSREEIAIVINKNNGKLLSVANKVIKDLVETQKIRKWSEEYCERWLNLTDKK